MITYFIYVLYMYIHTYNTVSNYITSILLLTNLIPWGLARGEGEWAIFKISTIRVSTKSHPSIFTPSQIRKKAKGKK